MLAIDCIHRYCKHLALSVGEILDETPQSEISTCIESVQFKPRTLSYATRD